MKNLLNERPGVELSGRMLASIELVREDDIRDKKVLDIGCGFGWFETHLIKAGAKSIVGIELTDEDLKTARENIVDPRVSFKIGSAIDLPFVDSSFDTVVGWEVLEHIPRKSEAKMLSEIHRVLRPNGVAYLSTPYRSFLATTLDPAFWIQGHRHYSKKKLIRYAAMSGFKVVKVSVRGGIWTVLSIVNMYFTKWFLHRNIFFPNFFRQKEKNEYKRENGIADIFIKLIATS